MTQTKQIKNASPDVLTDLQALAEFLNDIAFHFEDKVPAQYKGNLEVIREWLTDVEDMTMPEFSQTIGTYRKVLDMLSNHGHITYREFRTTRSKLNTIENLSHCV